MNKIERVTKVERTDEYVKIFYTVTDEYQKENTLFFKHRILEIKLNDLSQEDYADSTQI